VPEKDLASWQQILGFVGVAGMTWLSIWKYMGMSKDNAEVKKDNAEFKKEVAETVNALKVEIKTVSAEVFAHKSLARTLIETMETNTKKIEAIDKYITDERTEKMRSQAELIIKQGEEIKRLREQ